MREGELACLHKKPLPSIGGTCQSWTTPHIGGRALSWFSFSSHANHHYSIEFHVHQKLVKIRGPQITLLASDHPMVREIHASAHRSHCGPLTPPQALGRPGKIREAPVHAVLNSGQLSAKIDEPARGSLKQESSIFYAAK
eukprot:1081402-Pelagomonas_calceolata.AAC.3